jgi:small subunit ribosomal protein S16
MLTIRLQRAGKKHKVLYRVILAEKTAAANKKFTEVLGHYNPHTKELVIKNQERLNYWLNDQHVDQSATVHNLFITKNILTGDKVKAFTAPKKEVVAEEPAKVEAKPEALVEEAPAAEAAPEVTEAPAEPAAEEPASEEAPAA